MNHYSCLLKKAHCHGTRKPRKTFSRSSETRQVVQNVGNCLATIIPILAWHIFRIVVAGSRQQAGQTLCIVTVLSVQNNERWISTQRKWNELIIQGEPHWNGVSARDTKRAHGEPGQDLSGEIPVPIADETCSTQEIPAVTSGVTPSSSTSTPISPGASSGSGVKRAHGESIVNQAGTRARISVLVAGLHGVNAAEGDGITDEWLSAWYPETHMSQKMVNEAKRKDMERFKRMKGYRVVIRESMESDEEGKMISTKMCHHKQRNRRTSNCQGTSGSTRVQHWRRTW